MPVKVDLRGNPDTREHQDAAQLQRIFRDEFQKNKSTNGEILILSNVTLFGQATKDVDIVVLGRLENYRTKIKTKVTFPKNGPRASKDSKQELRDVYINDFCFVIETKGHAADAIELVNGTTLKVGYGGKYHDATTQSENQKYALKGFFEDRLSYSPRICNFIWLRNVSTDSIRGLLGDYPAAADKHNLLPSTFGLRWIFQLACVQQAPFNATYEDGSPKPFCSFSSFSRGSFFDFEKVEEAFEVFTKTRHGMGDLTRRKIEQVTRAILKDQLYAQAIGEKLVVISGRAGTGKTVKLLNIACDLAKNSGSRCLILTYNHALVSDIKRTLALAGVPDGVDGHSVSISTLHKYFYEILCGFEIGTSSHGDGKVTIKDFLNRYESLLEELYEYIENGVIGEVELHELMKSRHEQIAWDYVLIDEAQDWKETEKKLIYFLFGRERTIIADGVDQLIRSQRPCNWTQGLRNDIDFRRTTEKRGLRQKTSLVNFVNQIAKELGTAWAIEPKEDLYGGKIVVKVGDYEEDLHRREFELCKQNGNSAYEMLFLVPPSLVDKRTGERSFSRTSEFQDMGISIWDGTNNDLRSTYSVDLDQHRLLQYDSCRGLEGWTVVCLEFDEFVRYKFERFQEEEDDQLTLETFAEKRERFVNLWTLIPLTRAIDTLVITIKNPDSETAQVLKEVYSSSPDSIEWLE